MEREDEFMGMDTISLVDEDGIETEFEILACAEMDGVEYMALAPLNDNPVDELMADAQLVFLRVSDEEDEDGSPYLEPIEDDDEYERVAEVFEEKLSEEYEFLDEDDE